MIKFTDDVVPPMLIAATDILTEKYAPPAANRWIGVGLAALGYIAGGWMGVGGNFMKNIGIASAPWAYESLYLAITEGMTTRAPASAPASNRLVMHPAGRANPISRWPAPALAPEFAFRPAD